MNIRLFGIAKDIIGDKFLTLSDAKNIATVGELKRWLSHQYPGLQGLKTYAIAVNNEYAEDATFIESNSEVAVLPPVSGG